MGFEIIGFWRRPRYRQRYAANHDQRDTMTQFTIKTIAIFAAACAGLASRAEACPRQRRPSTEKRDTEITRIAMVGLIDVDNDGTTDLESVRCIVKRNGGVIDAELGIDGRLTGKLRPDTQYVIVGKLADETTVSPRVARQFDAFMRRASELSIPVIQLKELLGRGSVRSGGEPDAKPAFPPRRPPPQPY